MELRYLDCVLLDFFLLVLDIFAVPLERVGLLFDMLVFLLVLEVLFGQRLLLLFDFFLQLRNLVVDDLVPPFNFLELFLAFGQVFAVQVSVRPNRLIQVLLLFQFSFSFDIFLLELTDEVVLQLDFFHWMPGRRHGFRIQGRGTSSQKQLMPVTDARGRHPTSKVSKEGAGLWKARSEEEGRRGGRQRGVQKTITTVEVLGVGLRCLNAVFFLFFLESLELLVLLVHFFVEPVEFVVFFFHKLVFLNFFFQLFFVVGVASVYVLLQNVSVPPEFLQGHPVFAFLFFLQIYLRFEEVDALHGDVLHFFTLRPLYDQLLALLLVNGIVVLQDALLLLQASQLVPEFLEVLEYLLHFLAHVDCFTINVIVSHLLLFILHILQLDLLPLRSNVIIYHFDLVLQLLQHLALV